MIQSYKIRITTECKRICLFHPSVLTETSQEDCFVGITVAKRIKFTDTSTFDISNYQIPRINYCIYNTKHCRGYDIWYSPVNILNHIKREYTVIPVLHSRQYHHYSMSTTSKLRTGKLSQLIKFMIAQPYIMTAITLFINLA